MKILVYLQREKGPRDLFRGYFSFSLEIKKVEKCFLFGNLHAAFRQKREVGAFYLNSFPITLNSK